MPTMATIGGHQTGSGGLQTASGRQTCPGDVRQLTAVAYINEPGGTGLIFVPTGKVGIALVLDDQHQGLVSAFIGSAEHQSRPVKPKVPEWLLNPCVARLIWALGVDRISIFSP